MSLMGCVTAIGPPFRTECTYGHTELIIKGASPIEAFDIPNEGSPAPVVCP